MKGHKVNRVFGWDTHGLPAELEAQKELGIDSVDQVKEMGIDKFNDACRASVLQVHQRVEGVRPPSGPLVDFEHGYKTLNITYMESVMWAFKQLYDKGLAYQATACCRTARRTRRRCPRTSCAWTPTCIRTVRTPPCPWP